MDTKKDEPKMFTCKACKYYRKPNFGDNWIWSACGHPAIREMGFVVKSVEDVTKKDWTKLEHLVKDVLKLEVIYLGGKIPNFEFPFRYESSWITGCDGYEEDKSHSFIFNG